MTADARERVRVEVLVRPDCHLCTEALVVIEDVCRDLRVAWRTVDIDIEVSEEIRSRHTDEVPVTFVDGVQHDYWRFDPERLRTALSR